MLRSDLLGQLWEYEIRAYARDVIDTPRRDNFSQNNNNVGISLLSMSIRRKVIYSCSCYLLRLLTSQHKIAHARWIDARYFWASYPLHGKLDAAIDQPETFGPQDRTRKRGFSDPRDLTDRQSGEGHSERHLYTARGLHSGRSYYLLRHY